MRTGIKYPKTPHIEGYSNITDHDDILIKVDNFLGEELVITEKVDGSNIMLICDSGIWSAYTRSGNPIDWRYSRLYELLYSLPVIDDRFVIFCEYLGFKHSIDYKKVPSLVYLISVLDKETDTFLSWNYTIDIANHLHIPTIPELYRGQIQSKSEFELLINSLLREPSTINTEVCKEGVVIRKVGEFPFCEFGCNVAKIVSDKFKREEPNPNIKFQIIQQEVGR